MVEKLSDEQLKYIQGNRDRRVSRRFPVSVGSVAAEVAKSGLLTGPAWRRRLVGVLEEDGGELLKHASLIGVRSGVLRLHVADPALMYSLRLAWEQRLLQLLRTKLPEAGICEVRFTAGAEPKR